MAFGNEEQVPDRIEEHDSALELGRGDRLSLDGGELVTLLGNALLELEITLVELGQMLGGHVAARGAACRRTPCVPRYPERGRLSHGPPTCSTQ